jgi:hypothetical protein
MRQLTAGRAKGMSHSISAFVTAIALLEHIRIGIDRSFATKDVTACLLLSANLALAVLGTWRSAFSPNGA